MPFTYDQFKLKMCISSHTHTSTAGLKIGNLYYLLKVDLTNESNMLYVNYFSFV